MSAHEGSGTAKGPTCTQEEGCEGKEQGPPAASSIARNANEVGASLSDRGATGGPPPARPLATGPMSGQGRASETQVPLLPMPEATAHVLSRVKVSLCTGALSRALARSKTRGFAAITVGFRHVHLLKQEHGLFDAAAEGAALLVEPCTYVLQLSNAQVGPGA